MKTSQLNRKLKNISLLTEAFSLRDLQSAYVLFAWLAFKGVPIEDFVVFMEYRIELQKLDQLGYFSAGTDPETASKVRALEKSITNPEFRRYARFVRLRRSLFSGPGSG